MNDNDLEALFAEAKAKQTEHDGARLTLNGHTHTLWPSRFTYRQRMEIASITGLTPTGLMLTFASDNSASLETFAAFIATSAYQTGLKPRQIDMDAITAYVEQQLLETPDPQIDVTILRPDTGTPPDDGATIITELDKDAGPESSGQ